MTGIGPKLSGHCLCGAVSFTAHALPISTVNCHCADCRRATGAVYGTVLYFRRSDVSAKGILGSYSHRSDRGTEVVKKFCPTCGSQLFACAAAWPDLIGVRAGCIDQPQAVRPERNVFRASSLDSTPIDPALPEFQGMP